MLCPLEDSAGKITKSPSTVSSDVFMLNGRFKNPFADRIALDAFMLKVENVGNASRSRL